MSTVVAVEINDAVSNASGGGVVQNTQAGTENEIQTAIPFVEDFMTL